MPKHKRFYIPYKKNQSLGERRCGVITNEPEIQNFKTDSERMVFEFTEETGKKVTCIQWGVPNLNRKKGENVIIFGFEKENNVFIVNRLLTNYELTG